MVYHAVSFPSLIKLRHTWVPQNCPVSEVQILIERASVFITVGNKQLVEHRECISIYIEDEESQRHCNSAIVGGTARKGYQKE